MSGGLDEDIKLDGVTLDGSKVKRHMPEHLTYHLTDSITVPTKIVNRIPFLNSMISFDSKVNIESLYRPIPLESIDSYSFKRIIEWVTYHLSQGHDLDRVFGGNPTPTQPLSENLLTSGVSEYDVAFIQKCSPIVFDIEDEKTGGVISEAMPRKDDDYLMNLIFTANYLQVDSIMALAAAELAMRIRSITRNPVLRNIEDKAAAIRSRFHIADDMTPEQKASTAYGLQGKRKPNRNKKSSKHYAKKGKKRTNRTKLYPF